MVILLLTGKVVQTQMVMDIQMLMVFGWLIQQEPQMHFRLMPHNGMIPTEMDMETTIHRTLGIETLFHSMRLSMLTPMRTVTETTSMATIPMTARASGAIQPRTEMVVLIPMVMDIPTSIHSISIRKRVSGRTSWAMPFLMTPTNGAIAMAMDLARTQSEIGIAVRIFLAPCLGIQAPVARCPKGMRTATTSPMTMISVLTPPRARVSTPMVAQDLNSIQMGTP